MDWRELNIKQYSAATSKERVEARKLLDAERLRCYNLDRETGSKELLAFTLKYMEGFEMPEVEIEDNVAIPQGEEAPVPRKRGRPAGTKTKTPESAGLLNAVEFISVVQIDTFEFSAYAALRNNFISAYSNVMSAGHPIAEELNLCPQIDKLKAALSRCGKSLAITENNGQISIKGDKLRALVPCLSEPLAPVVPDHPVLTGNFDILKSAFEAACTVADEKSERPMFASVLLDPNTVTATNGKVMLQYWHGIADLPPGTVIPKVFAQAIARHKYKITGIGGNFQTTINPATNENESFMRSLTIWFENGAWLKTQCYDERWQPFEHLLNVATQPQPVPAGLFEAIAAVEPFCEESSAIHFMQGAVSSHPEGQDTGAVYEVKGLPAGKIFHAKLVRQVSPYVKTLDLTTSNDRAYFYGGADANPIRGVFMGMAGSQ